MSTDTRQFWFNVTDPSGSTVRVVVDGYDLAKQVKKALRDADYRCGITINPVTVHFAQSEEDTAAAKKILNQVRGIV